MNKENTEHPKVLKHIIEERHSIFPKDYTGAAVPEEIISEVLNAAVLGPSHKRTRPWRFRVFKGDDRLELGRELQRIYKETTPEFQFLRKKYDDFMFKVTQAGAIISIVVEYSGLVPEWEEVAAVAMAVENMYLTCTASNIGCYWGSPGLVKHMGDFLKLEENQQSLGFFYMGILE
ncbi:nitroreductase family protein [Weeksellaceae bacterium A-14]